MVGKIGKRNWLQRGISSVGTFVNSVKVQAAWLAGDIAAALGLQPDWDAGRTVREPQNYSEAVLEAMPIEQEVVQAEKEVVPDPITSLTTSTTIPTVRRPLSQGGGYIAHLTGPGSARFDDSGRDRGGDFTGKLTPLSVGARRVALGYGNGTYYHDCEDLYGSMELLSPKPISALGEQRRVPVTIEYLNVIPACHPYTHLLPRRELWLIKVRRGAKRVYRLLIPAGTACLPAIEQAMLGDSAEFFTSDELVAIGRSQPLKLAELVDNKEKGKGESND